MRYFIKRYGEVRAENAAKPSSQKSRPISALLNSLPVVESSLDYGCGKGRYLKEISSTCDQLTLVDSEWQLNRTQELAWGRTSISETFEKSNAIKTETTKLLSSGLSDRFCRAYCLNVLSSVPFASIRRAIARRVARSVKPSGEIVVSHQYRNSDFNLMKRKKNCIQYGDGILVDSLRGYSYYSLMTPDEFCEIWLSSGLTEVKRTRIEGSVFVIFVKGDNDD